MSVKTQKIIRFIPILNLIPIFIFLGICFKMPDVQRYFLKFMMKIFAMCLIPIIICTFLLFVFKNYILQQILFFVLVYLCFLIVSFASVKAQIEINK